MSQGSVAVHGSEAHHPGPGTYAFIALVLSMITLLEFWAFYMPWLHEIGLSDADIAKLRVEGAV